MATKTPFPFFETRFFTDEGLPAEGHKLEQFLAGTTNDQDTWSNRAGSSLNAHPILLDSTGRCSIFGTPGVLYDFVLLDANDAEVYTWEDIEPAAAEVTGEFVELAGDTMEGPLVLEADPTSNLMAATKQYVDNAITNALATVQSLVDTATDAAADATAAAAAVKPAFYSLDSATGGAVSRSVYLSAGTWQVVLETRARAANPASSSISATVTQSATVDSCTVGTSIAITKNASDTQTTNVSATAVGSLVVSTAGTFTMSMAAVSLSSQTSQGSTLTVSLQ